MLLMLILLWPGLSACGEMARPTVPTFETPTAPATPASYDGVPGAATLGYPTRPPLPRPSVATAGATEAAPPSPESEDEAAGVGAPSDRVLGDADPTAIAKLFSTYGPSFGGAPGLPLTPGTKRSGQPSRPAPTPTLNTNPGAVRIESLRTTQASFLTAYKQASVKLLEASRTARLVFASANILKSDRTTWTFMFVALEGPRMWRVIYDTDGNRLDLREVAASMLSDAGLIDMNRVLDSPALLDKAVATGLNVSLPVDIISFQVEGLTKQPCFIFTNVAQGKQVAIHAYTGQVVRNDFA